LKQDIVNNNKEIKRLDSI